MGTRFLRYVGVDYSGAETIESYLPGLSAYVAAPDHPPFEIMPLGGRRYWTRQSLARGLADLLSDGVPTMVGVDHAFSFPLSYFRKYKLARDDWRAFLDDFCAHWPTDEPHTYVDFVRDGLCGQGHARSGSSRSRRLVEQRCRAKSVFHFDVPGSVAKSTHAGLPWLRFLMNQPGLNLHAWPFDGWVPSPGVSVIAEVYPSLWSRGYPREGRNNHQQDAFAVAAWMRDTDVSGGLDDYFSPNLDRPTKRHAMTEGWILGVV